MYYLIPSVGINSVLLLTLLSITSRFWLFLVCLYGGARFYYSITGLSTMKESSESSCWTYPRFCFFTFLSDSESEARILCIGFVTLFDFCSIGCIGCLSMSSNVYWQIIMCSSRPFGNTILVSTWLPYVLGAESALFSSIATLFQMFRVLIRR